MTRERTNATRLLSSRSAASVVGGLALYALLTGCAVEESVEPSASTDSAMQRCMNTSADRLASIAEKMNGQKSGGYCYRYVKAHLRSAGFSTTAISGQASAYMFADWAEANPSALAKMGFQKANIDLDDVPRGAVLVWPRGMCGYNKEHGHIEIVVDQMSSRACSDFCGRIKKGCGTPDIFVPKGCTQASVAEVDDGNDEWANEPAAPNDAPTDDEEGATPAGSCWSPTMQAQMDAYACVQSTANGIWFQCKDGLWYRGVIGEEGPFTTCTEMHAR